MKNCDHCHKKATYSTGLIDSRGVYHPGNACDDHAGVSVMLRDHQAFLDQFVIRMRLFSEVSLRPLFYAGTS